MKFFTLFLSLILSFFLFNCGNNISQPKVQNGKINLKNWDFSSNNPIKLNGSWEFYPQKFLLGDEFENYKKDTIYYPVPESWNKLPSHPGYGTYRLIIEKNSNKQKLSFKILSIKSSYNFFINGKLIYTQGRVGKLKENSFPLITSKILHLENLNIETLEVVIHISDFYHGEGGIWREIYLGEPEKIINHHYLSVSKDFIFFGMIFMIGLHYFSYHLIRKDRSNVFLPFSIFCISISLRILITEERLLVKLLPNIYSDIYIKGDYIFEFIANASFIQFISNYFIKLQNKNKIMKLFYYSFYSLSLIIFITPSLYATDIERFFRPVIIPIGFYIIYHYRELIKQKNINAKIALIFFSILLGVATNDILYSLGLIESLYLLPVGIIIFISYLSFFISLNISKSFEEFKQLSNQLEKVSEVKDNFMSNLSHELKTPLSLIYAYSELLSDEGNDPTVSRSYGQDIFRETSVLIEIINDLMMVTDLETKFNLKIEKVQLSQMINDSINYLNNFISEKGTKFHLNNLDVFINCDKSLLTKVFIIIIKNSILYGKTSGNIWISSKEEQNKIQIIFSDDGAGVPEESIRKIYDKFYRVDNSITYKVSGVGVGLFIAKRIVQLHKGEIHSNNNLEKGLITYINLPKQVN